MACSVETTRVSLEDCTCPICMCILIEPVTMPCHHELCRPCFKQNVEEASLLCPMCRTRIGTWARHATKTKTLVNQERWEQIQNLFPKRVRLRLEGKDEEDDSCDVTFHPPIHLAAPGEIRKEYEEELKKLRQQLVQERRKEELESEALIRRLQEEEERERAKQNVQQEEINQHDEVLARELDKVINEAGTDDPIDLLLEESKSRLTRSNSAASSKSCQSNGGPLDTFFNKYKAQTETLQTSPYPYPCISPSEKEKRTENSPSNSSIGKRSNSSAKTEIYPYNLVDHTYCPNPNAPKSSTVARPPSDEVMTISDSSLDTVKERSESTKERSESVGSNDSISNELCHFKPILSCPRTPPRKMADGKIVDPPVVRTTPRNLSRNGFTSPVDSVTSPGLEPGSPIMQKRLTELALERQLQVQERSKSTSTGPDDQIHLTSVQRQSNSHYLRNSTHAVENLSRPPLHSANESLPGDSIGIGSKSGGLLIPLEPVLEEHDQGEFDFTPVLLNLRKPSTSHSADHKDCHQPSTSRSPLNVKSPSLEKARRSRHNSKEKGQLSNQRSIKDWFKTEDKSGANSADLFEVTEDVVQIDISDKLRKNSGEDFRAGGEGANMNIGHSDSEFEEAVELVDKKKRRLKVREKGDAEMTLAKTQKKSSPVVDLTETVRKKKRHKSEKCANVLSDDNVSDNSEFNIDLGNQETSLRKKRRKKGKGKKNSEDVEENEQLVSDDELLPNSRHQKFIQQVDSEIAFLSESELDFSETETSSPVRKSARKRCRKGGKEKGFEFDVDTLEMSDTDQSGDSHPVSRKRKAKNIYRNGTVGVRSVSDYSGDEEDEFQVKKKSSKKIRKNVTSTECMSETENADSEMREKSRKRGNKTLSSESKVDDLELCEVSATISSVSSPSHKRGKNRRKKDSVNEADSNCGNSNDEDAEKQDTQKHKKSTLPTARRKRAARKITDEKFDPAESDLNINSSEDESDERKSKTSSQRHKQGRRKFKDKDVLLTEVAVDSEDEDDQVVKKSMKHIKKKVRIVKNGENHEEEAKVNTSGDEDPVVTSKLKVSSPRRKRGTRRRMEDETYHPSDAEVHGSEEENLEDVKLVKQKMRRLRRGVLKDESETLDAEELKLPRQRRKRKAVVNNDKDNEQSDVEENVQKSTRQGRLKRHEKNPNVGDSDNDSMKEVEQGRPKKASPKKQSPKKSSPKKSSPRKTPVKRAQCSETESSSPCKKRRTKMVIDTDTALIGKRIHLRKCATEELLEENVDPNANSNNSSVLPSPSRGRRKTRNTSTKPDTVTPDVTPGKQVQTEQDESDSGEDIDSGDDAFESPAKSFKPQLTKKRSETVSVKALKPKSPALRKGRRRHTTGEQQSIVRYLSGASDVDLRQDVDEEAESDTTECASQEDEDRKIALRLQRQFNLEQKFRIAAERFKGGAEQYQFRRKPRYVD